MEPVEVLRSQQARMTVEREVMRCWLVLWCISLACMVAAIFTVMYDVRHGAYMKCARSCEVFLMRHGEKSDDGSLGLNETGLLRAQLLEQFVVDEKRWPSFQSPIYANAPRNGSQRSIDTARPLANVLDIAVDSSWDASDTAGVARAVKRHAMLLATAACEPTALLIIWDHCDIPQLRVALGCRGNRCLECWSDACYDRVDRYRYIQIVPKWKRRERNHNLTLETLPSTHMGLGPRCGTLPETFDQCAGRPSATECVVAR
ncbi:hypothetical protein M885DRAFT_614630 [Pelagophyceae sp. CCMP2097]|nr:hypothetical protein M885DRAFT_614630 [Pelagophyceae sp. CCMP2097]